MYNKKMIKSINKNDKNNGSKIDESVGILPYIFMVLGLITWFLSLIFFIIYNFLLKNILWKKYALELLIFMLIIYFALFIMTVVIILLEGGKIDLSLKSKIKVLFYNPIFMISYVPCAIKALTSKEVKWTKTNHG